MTSAFRPLHSGLVRAAEGRPDHTAIEAPSGTMSYGELGQRARALAATLRRLRPAPAEGALAVTAVLAPRDLHACEAIAGILLSGHGYVPLNPAFPPDRTAGMLARARARALVCDQECLDQLPEILPHCPEVALVVVLGPPGEALSALAAAHPELRWAAKPDFEDPNAWLAPSVEPDAVAYLLFTSGSTGLPKGVMVAQRNVRHFIDVMQDRYRFEPTDRFSQMFELVFDLSVFDLFMSWEAGGCLCIPGRKDTLIPSDYIRRHRLTVWFSVPSVAMLMMRLRQLAPGAFPDLRWSLFCGEALQCDAADAWAAAASRSTVENLYGPTELTLACTLYRWAREGSRDESEHGVVPIGFPYPGMTALVVDDRLDEVPPGEVGELLMAGPQVALGYLDDRERTERAFVIPPGQTARHYLTGDLVRRPHGSEPLIYMGRADQQIKIHGHRVELGEIEAVLRDVTSADLAVVVPHPVRDGAVQGLVAFVQADSVDERAVKARLGERLPGYMVPAKTLSVARFPLNSNGKVDRNALRAQLDG